MASDQQTWGDVPDRTVSSNTSHSEWVARVGRKLWAVLAYSAVYLALIAAAEVLIVQYVLGLPPSPAPLVGALVTFAIYANDRLVDLETDGTSNPRRTAFVHRYRSELYVLAAIAYGVGAALSALGGPLAFAIALFPGGVWVAYAVNWIPVSGLGVARLKEILVVNSLLVALAWSLSVVLLPLAFANAAVTPAVGVVFLYFVLATFVNTEVANVRDVESDRESGVSTIPSTLGVRHTRAVLYGIVLLTAAVLGAAVMSDVLAATSAAVLSLGLVGLVGVVALLGRSDRPNLLSIAAECTRLPVYAVFALAIVG